MSSSAKVLKNTAKYKVRSKIMGWMNEAMKIEIGRMLQEGVSDEGIQAVVEDWKRQVSINPYATYAAFVEYGLPLIDQSKVVEGSIIKDGKVIQVRGE
jgi:hypothetical protein